MIFEQIKTRSFQKRHFDNGPGEKPSFSKIDRFKMMRAESSVGNFLADQLAVLSRYIISQLTYAFKIADWPYDFIKDELFQAYGETGREHSGIND